MVEATKEAQSALTKAADNMAHFYDVHQKTAPTYQVGDKVWLSSQKITTVCPTKTLDHKWLGPYKVNKLISQSA